MTERMRARPASPVNAKTLFAFLTAVLWIVWFLGSAAFDVFYHPLDVRTELAIDGVSSVSGFLLCLLIARMFGSRLRDRRRLALIVVMVAAALWCTGHLVAVQWASSGPLDGGWSQQVLINLQAAWIFIAWYYGWAALAFRSEAELRDVEIAQAETSSAQAEHASLRYQINPDLLLGTFGMLTQMEDRGERENAERTVESLSRYLRASLAEVPNNKITLREEIATSRNLLSIVEGSASHRFESWIHIPEKAQECLVPNLCLQPFLMAVAPNILLSAKVRATLTISALLREGRLQISARWSISSPSSDDGRAVQVAADVTRRKVAYCYGDDAQVIVERATGNLLMVLLDVPIEAAREDS